MSNKCFMFQLHSIALGQSVSSWMTNLIAGVSLEERLVPKALVFGY